MNQCGWLETLLKVLPPEEVVLKCFIMESGDMCVDLVGIWRRPLLYVNNLAFQQPRVHFKLRIMPWILHLFSCKLTDALETRWLYTTVATEDGRITDVNLAVV